MRFFDASARLRAEFALRESKVRYHAPFRSSPVPFVVLAANEPDFTITGANDAYLAATLTTRETLIGRRLFDVFTDEPSRASEVRYRQLFERIDEGFCIIEMILDDDMPVDYWFVDVNPAFESHTGIADAKGRFMRDIAPEHKQHWFDVYGEVAITGRARRFEAWAPAFERIYGLRREEIQRVGLGPARASDERERRRRL